MKDLRDEYDILARQLDDLVYYRKNLRSGPSFNMWEQDFSGKVKYRDFEYEESRLMDKEVDIRVRMEELRRRQRGLNEQRLNPASGCRLDELYPTLPASGALLRFDPSNKGEGRWRYKPDKQQVGEGDIGYRNLAIGVKSFRTSTGEMSWSLESPFVLVHPDAAITLLPCEPVLVGDHTPYIKIMVNTVRRDSEILWSPVSDLVIV